MKVTLLNALLRAALLLTTVGGPTLAQGTPAPPVPVAVPVAVPPGPVGLLPPVSADPIFVAYPPEKYVVAFDHVLLEGSVQPGASLTLNGAPLPVGADGLFIAWVPLQPGVNDLVLQSTLAGVSSRVARQVTSAPPVPLTGAAQITPGSVLPAGNRVAYVQPALLDERAVPVGFTGTPGGRASYMVGSLGPYPLPEATPGRYEGTFLLPPLLPAAPVTYSLTAADGTVASASSAGLVSVTGAGPRVAEVTASIPGRGVQAGTTVWRNGAGRNYALFPRPGARTVVVGEDGSTYAAQVAGGLILNAPKSTLTLLPEGTPLPRAVFTAIDVRAAGAYTEVRLNLPVRVPFTVEQQVQPGSSSLDLRLYHAVADVDFIVSGFPPGAVRDVRWVHESDNVARVHVDLTGAPWGYDVTYDGTALVLRVRNAPVIDARRPLLGRTVVIDPGHGGDEFGGAGALRVPEKHLNLALGVRVAQLLEARGARVILTRAGDVTVPIYNRPLLAEASDAELLVSIHANALPDGVNPASKRGSGVYYYQPQARALADTLLGSLVEGLPDVGNDGVHYQNLALARPTTQLSVLIETAFLTDAGNLRVLMSDVGRERFAQAIARGIERYYRNAARPDRAARP